MTSQGFMRLLTRLDACSPAKEWAKGKSLGVVWRTCKRGDWLLWLSAKMAGKRGWPTQEQYFVALEARRQYMSKHFWDIPASKYLSESAKIVRRHLKEPKP